MFVFRIAVSLRIPSLEEKSLVKITIQVTTTLPALALLQRRHLLFFYMSEVSLREFREYYVTMVLKCVTNLVMFCAHVSRDQRPNRQPCSAEVLFTRSAASNATLCTMDRRTEPWKQG